MSGYPQYSQYSTAQYASNYEEQPVMQEQPVPQQQSQQDNYLQQFASLVKTYNISNFMAKKLRKLEQFDVVLVLDDSGSMNMPLQEDPNAAFDAPNGMTRWKELENAVTLVVSIAGILDRDGISIFTMNRGDMHGVTGTSQTGAIFSRPAAGVTPTNDTLQRVFTHFKTNPTDKKKLLIIFTDGEPTDKYGRKDGQVALVKKTLSARQTEEDIYVVFVKATDDTSADYLDGWDKELKRVDVVDDYLSEKKEIQKVQGSSFEFSSGDYICKMLLGSIDPEIDSLDEKKR